MFFKFISIRYKLLTFIVILLGGAMLTYLLFAINLFNNDKNAYIYDSNALLAKATASQSANYFGSTMKTMQFVVEPFLKSGAEQSASHSKKAIDFLTSETNIISFDIYRASDTALNTTKKSRLFHYEKPSFFSQNNLGKDFLEGLTEKRPFSSPEAYKDKLVIENISTDETPPLLRTSALLSPRENGQYLLVSAILSTEGLIELFKNQQIYTAYLLDEFGNLIIHPNIDLVRKRANFFSNPTLRSFISSGVSNGATEGEAEDGKKMIYSYSKLGLGNLLLVSEISKEKAFLASRHLIQKSIMIAATLIALFIMFSIIFSRTLTKPLEVLNRATKKIAKGDFEVQVSTDSKDEIGSLGSSISAMAKEIKRLFAETKEKARMEKELETAKLVQETLFPENRVQAGNLDICAFFSPASECGGDWWGTFTIGDHSVIMIADATGHGVPSALITAAAQSCSSTLQKMYTNQSGSKMSPALIAEYFNNSIYNCSKGLVYMTFFVGIIDRKTKQIVFTSASHNLPFVCKENMPGKDVREKDHIQVLVCKPDPILGEKPNSKYNEHTYQLSAGDALVFYTDGLIEGTDTHGKEFGERHLIKILSESYHSSPLEMKDKIVSESMKYFEGKPLDDDITLVVTKIV